MLKIREIAKERINEHMLLSCPHCEKLTINKVQEGEYNRLFTVCNQCWDVIYFDNYDDENRYEKVEEE